MASEIKVDTISEKTSAGGVTIDGLLIKDGGISGDVSLIGTTPTFTIGDAGTEDAALVFDGNAQDYYIALDDSADDLLIGLGSTVGTTPAIAIDENLKVNIPVTTASTSASTGSLTTGGGMGVGADLYVGDDTYLITDSAVLGFGADKDTTLTHTDGTGLTLNSTNKLCFNDASQFVQGSSATVLSIGATDEIDLTATAVDLNGTLNVSGVATFQATPVFPDGSLALADLDIDGGTDIGAALVDADEIIVDDGGGGANRRCDMSRVKTYVGGDNTPAFSAYIDADDNFADATWVKAEFDAETLDTDSAYDASTNFRFTPAVAGTYLFFCNAILESNGNSELDNGGLRLYKNGATIAQVFNDFGGTAVKKHDYTLHAVDTSDADDYYEMYIYLNDTSGDPTIDGGTAPIDAQFSAIRIAGA